MGNPCPRGVREYRCNVCGLVEDRDVNAARNILSRGSTAAGWGIESTETPIRPGIFVTEMSPGYRGRMQNRTQVHDCDFAM
ncbi:MAG: transposase [Alphaproteobacteria bacterium]|nr:transposase [Alphaproteobacteria bacterium]